jgi:ATP-binding protein involved in chromosome partitioning
MTDAGLESSRIRGVRHVIAVASGKGGVGKSTVAVNLALALSAMDTRCGLLDVDMYGPSAPVMMGLRGGHLRAGPEGRIDPLESHGVKVISVGFMVPDGDALIWRGAILDQVIRDFVHNVNWGALDYLIVDMPPGTGDIPLSLHRAAAFTGVVLVTTPQGVALADVERCFDLYAELGVPVLGIVENMSGLTCPHCGNPIDLFVPGGGEDLSERYDKPLLGTIPFDPGVGMCGDMGLPVVLAQPDSPAASAFRAVARSLSVRDVHFAS